MRPTSSESTAMPPAGGQIPGSGGRVDGARVDGAANTGSALDPKMHPGYPSNLQTYQNGPSAETGDLGASRRR